MQTLTNTVDVSTSLINGFSRTQYGFSPNMFYIVHLIYPFKFEPGVKYQTNQIIDIFFKNQHHLWIDNKTPFKVYGNQKDVIFQKKYLTEILKKSTKHILPYGTQYRNMRTQCNQVVLLFQSL